MSPNFQGAAALAPAVSAIAGNMARPVTSTIANPTWDKGRRHRAASVTGTMPRPTPNKRKSTAKAGPTNKAMPSTCRLISTGYRRGTIRTVSPKLLRSSQEEAFARKAGSSVSMMLFARLGRRREGGELLPDTLSIGEPEHDGSEV